MKRLQILRRVMRETGASKIWLGFLVLFFASALAIWLIEPEMKTYGDALWYCYSVVTTVGFGDTIAQHIVSRVLSVVLSIAAILVIALVTGVIVNFYTEVTSLKNKETVVAFMDRLERLPELSHDELVEISERVKEFRDR